MDAVIEMACELLRHCRRPTEVVQAPPRTDHSCVTGCKASTTNASLQ
jgi:hypothetical protein